MTPRPEDRWDAARMRTCPYCAETIKLAAKVCPRCRQWLTLRSMRNPAVYLWAVGLPHLVISALLFMAFLTYLSRWLHPKPEYTEFVNSLRVVESRMNWAQAKDGPRIYIVGLLTNQSDFAWRRMECECRFFDAKGQLVDADHTFTLATVQPHEETAFRVVASPNRATNDYASCRVSVSAAQNTKGLW
jgi:hypothetical protein